MEKKPKWALEIARTYGSYEHLCQKFSYLNKNVFADNPMECFKRETPSLVQMDVAYGKGSSANWLYNVLQGMFIFLGVTNDKFSKEQVYNLAQTIVANYRTLKLAEILLFVSRFEAGKYGKFYGDTSYALTVTTAINTFMVERVDYYDVIEQERISKKEESKNAISLEEWKQMMKEQGEEVMSL